ncbi:nucleoside-diphosphate kinase, partial [Corynebacterium propinquum]
MAVQRTFSIIKPDAVATNVIGEITTRFEKACLQVVASKLKQLPKSEAEVFYAEHRPRGFYCALV